MGQQAKPYTEAQIAGIEAAAALADQDTTIPRMLANLSAMRAERDEARERVAVLEAERDTLRGALDESRGQVRTLRLTIDQNVADLATMQTERDAWRTAAERNSNTATRLETQLRETRAAWVQLMADAEKFSLRLEDVRKIAAVLRDPTREEYPADVRDPAERTVGAIVRLLELFPEEK